MAEGGILAVQIVGIRVHNEKLAAGAVGIHGPGHADDAALVADRVVDAVLAELALDGPAGAAHAGPRRVAALDHEARNDPVKDRPVIKLVVNQFQEVFYCDRSRFFIELNIDDASVFHGDPDHPVSSFFMLSPKKQSCLP